MKGAWWFAIGVMGSLLACSSAEESAPVVTLGTAGNGGASAAGAAAAGAAGASAAGAAGASASGAAGASGAGAGAGGVTAGGAAGAAAGSSGSGAVAGHAGAGAAAGSSGASAGGASGASAGAAGSGGSGQAGAASCAVTPAPLLTYTLASAAYPSSTHPSVAVHVPAGFRPCDRPGLVVFFHGFDNCVENVIGSVDSACEPGGPARAAMHLSDQLDAAHVNAVLVVVELAYDQATGDPGALADAGGLRALLHELLVMHLDAELGTPLDVGDLDRVVIGSHSGGYWATAVALSSGMVDQITEIDLFDSLYAYQSTFEGFIENDVSSFDPSAPHPMRFFDAYTSGGGTLDDSQSMAATIGPKLASAGLSASFLDDETTATLDDTAFEHPVIFKHSALAHDDVPRYYFGKVLPHAGFATLP